MFTGETTVQSKLLYRGYQLEVRRAPLGWRVGIYPSTCGSADPKSMRSHGTR